METWTVQLLAKPWDRMRSCREPRTPAGLCCRHVGCRSLRSRIKKGDREGSTVLDVRWLHRQIPCFHLRNSPTGLRDCASVKRDHWMLGTVNWEQGPFKGALSSRSPLWATDLFLRKSFDKTVKLLSDRSQGEYLSTCWSKVGHNVNNFTFYICLSLRSDFCGHLLGKSPQQWVSYRECDWGFPGMRAQVPKSCPVLPPLCAVC